MLKEEAMQIAAQAWCTPETEHLVMEPKLAEAFADLLVKHTTSPNIASIPLHTRVIQTVEKLREEAREYHQLPEGMQKATRHELYKNTGGFGKATVAAIDQFIVVENDLINKGKA